MSRNTIPGLLLILLTTTVSFCHGDPQKTVQVVGVTECSDCHDQNNIKTSHAFKGLKVSIDCKNEAGEMKSRGFGDLDEEGKFRVEFPKEMMMMESGNKLKEECYAQLHSASGSLCPTMSSKIGYVSESDGKHTFSPLGNLKLSPKTCTNSAKFPFRLRPIFRPRPELPPQIGPIYAPPFPHIPIHFPPSPPSDPPPYIDPIYKNTLPPFVPIYKKRPLPSIPVYEKPYKPLPKFP